MTSKVSKETGIPDYVFEGLEAVRVGGETNMLMKANVIIIAEDMGCDECADYLRKHDSGYGTILMQHFGAWKVEQANRVE